jgi:hypothetical protein
MAYIGCLERSVIGHNAAPHAEKLRGCLISLHSEHLVCEILFIPNS